MDIVRILRDAIDRVPVGDHSTGLNAILRHITAAIRHFERDRISDPDGFTDTIYRTNQSYEGSLKEAYRVLAGKDPVGKTTHEIEKYLDNNSVVRPRVLTQLTRYRQDYRNPSTHDYKLDFDENEALLAIVSVCAFAKLLVDQISGKLVYNTASATTLGHDRNINIRSLDELVSLASFIIIDTISDIPKINAITVETFPSLLSGRFDSYGMSSSLQWEATDGRYRWDVVVSKGDFCVAVEQRWSIDTEYPGLLDAIRFSKLGLITDQSVGAAIIVVRMDEGPPYKSFEISSPNGRILLISRMDESHIRKFLTNEDG